MPKPAYHRSQKPDRSGGIRLALLIAMALATLATEVLASNFASQSAGMLGQGFPLLNIGTAIVTLLLMVFTAAKATATTYYVRTTGNDGNSGTSAGAAWATFDEATSSTLAGDIVYFGAGTYNENIEPSVDGSSGSPIQFIADTDGTQTGDAGIVILDGLVSGSDGNPMKMDKDNYLEFVGVKFVGNGKEGIKIKDSVGIILKKCEVYNSTIGIKIEGDSEATITNCLVRDNSQSGFNHKANNTYAITMMNCTIANNGDEGIKQEKGDLILTNSIIYGSGNHGLDANGDSLTHTYNLLYNNSPGDYRRTTQGTGEILVDPLFQSASYYQLQFGSPARDAGTSSGSPPSDDIEGTVRPSDGGYDMGCYERILGLVGHWNLDEASGTTADDASGEANDGTVTGTTFAVSSENVCQTDSTGLRLNGATDYISVVNDTSLELTDGMTIMAWVRADSFGSGTDVDSIVRKGTTNPLDYALVVDDGKVSLVLDDSDTAGFTGDTVLNVDRWYHVAATWDGTEAKIYVNGVRDNGSTHSFSSTLGTDSRPLYLGGHAAGALFDGTIDDVQIYDNAIPASVISDTYGLKAYYKLDESSGSTADDASENENDGTLVDSPTWQSTGGQIDGALEFDGSNHVSISDPGVGTGSFSVAAWIKPDNMTGFDNTWGAGIARSTHNEAIGDWMLSVDNNGSVHFTHWESSGNDTDGVSYTDDGVITTGIWYHVAATWDGTTHRIYVNGIEQTIAGTEATDTGWLTAHEFGRIFPYSTDIFDGLIDEFKIFNRAICVDEVKDSHGEGAPGGIRIIKWLETQ